MDTRHRRSISGIVFMLSGGTVAWKCRVQPTVSLSSTEAELLCATDAGCMALCLHSILCDLGILQHSATAIFEDNHGALLVANAGQPTRHTRHLDIREFAIQQWVEQDLLTLDSIASALNAADLLTKQTPPPSFLHHLDVITGQLPPTWSSFSS